MGSDDADSSERKNSSEGPSYLEIFPNDEMNLSNPTFVLWGRLQLERRPCNLDLHTCVDPGQRVLLDWNFGIYESEMLEPPEVLEAGHVQFFNYVRKNYPSDQNYRYSNLCERLELKFKRHLADAENLSRLKTALLEEDPEELQNFLSDSPLTVKNQQCPYYIRATTMSRSTFMSSFQEVSESQKPVEPELEDEPVLDLDTITWEELPPVDELKELSVATSPIGGTPLEEVEPGEMVKVRLVGKLVKKLPDEQVDDRREQASLPFRGEIIKIDEEPELPPTVTDDPEKYRLLVIEVENEIYGKVYLRDSEKVILPDDNNKSPKAGDGSWSSILYTKLASSRWPFYVGLALAVIVAFWIYCCLPT